MQAKAAASRVLAMSESSSTRGVVLAAAAVAAGGCRLARRARDAPRGAPAGAWGIDTKLGGAVWPRRPPR